MANNNSPFGLRWEGLATGFTTPSFSLIPRKIAAADTQKIWRGDGVKNLATGYVSAIVAAGTVASQWAGIFWGCSYFSLSQGKRIVSPVWVGGDNVGDVDALLIPLIGSPPMLFVAQAAAGPITFADIGATVDIAYQAGVTYSGWGKSGTTIGTPGTTATLPFRIQALYSQYVPAGTPGTDDTSANNWAVVSFNSAQETGI